MPITLFINTKYRRHVPLFLLLISALSVIIPLQAVMADGMIFPPPHTNQPQIFSVKYHHVAVNIDDQAAVTAVDQVFHNETSRDQEGIYMFPLVEGSVINRFSMYAGDREVEGKILPKEEARRLYESIIRQQKDPAILEYVGRNTFRASIYPIPANGEKRVKLEYSEVLPKEGGMVKYVYPLSIERFSAKPLEDVIITINLRSKLPISNVYSPTHEIDVKQESPTQINVVWKAKHIKPDRDLILYYTLSDDTFPIEVLTYREPGQPGFFMMLASPKQQPDLKPLPKDIVFVLDRTGSMAGNKINQAKAALSYCLNTLNREDNFNLITFNENASWLEERLVPASKDNVDAALRMVQSVDARGGTNIDKALSLALGQFESSGNANNRRPYIVFLTDGLPTVGETDVNKILENAGAHNKNRVKVFAFGVGYDVNARFLDKLAQDSMADADYIRPEEDIEVKVSAFFDKVRDPVLADTKLTITGVRTEDTYPSDPLPDVFNGGQLIVIGRYDGEGEAIFTLSGISQGKQQSIKERVIMPKTSSNNEFIPRLWAARKIGYLLDEIRLNRNQELIDEVVRLSREYGIPTEFTSFFADEGGYNIALDEGLRQARTRMDVALKADTDAWAVNQSANARDLRNQTVVLGAAQREGYAASAAGGPTSYGGYNTYSGKGIGSTNTYRDAAGQVVSVDSIQNVGNRTFYRQQNQWIDARYKSQQVHNIRMYSEAHFQLLEEEPELRKYSILGEVIVTVNGNAIQIGTEGKEKLTKEELDIILGRKKA